MGLKIGKDTKMITIVKEEKVFTNSDTIQKRALGDFPEDIKEVVTEGRFFCYINSYNKVS